jgi:hypothetical protein
MAYIRLKVTFLGFRSGLRNREHNSYRFGLVRIGLKRNSRLNFIRSELMLDKFIENNDSLSYD